jgi:hypothetical protein
MCGEMWRPRILDMLTYLRFLEGRYAYGEGGIRTHGTPEGTTVFETVPIDRSGTSPSGARMHRKAGAL